MIISGVSPEPSGIGNSGTSSTPDRGIAATESKRTQLAAKARINRLNLKNGLRLFDMGTAPHRNCLEYCLAGDAANNSIATLTVDSRLVRDFRLRFAGLLR